MVRPIQSETAAKPQRTVARISSTQAKGRSYTGCLECKLRKIKCDESKPTCGQCNRTGRECSGSTLQRSVRWSDKHEKFKNQRNPSHHQKTPRTTTANSGKCKDRCSGNSPGSASTPEENALSYPAIDVDANSKRTTPDLDLPRFLEINSEPVISPPSSNTDCSQTRNLLCDISSVTDSTRDVEMPYFLMEDWAVDDNQNFNPDIFGSHVEFEDSIYQDLAAAAFTPSSGHSFEYSASHGILLDSDPFDLATNDQNMGDCPLPLEEPNSTNGTVTRGNSFGDNVMFDSRQSFGSDFFDNFDNRYRTRGEGSIRPQPILESTRLVEHYFARVCALFSTFDSELNPFRLFVKQKWQSSELIYYTVQSMAAACLWDESPHMRRQAATNQILAVNCLQRELELSKLSTSIEALFALFLLGLSSCWHDHRAFGLQHLKVAQAAILEDSPGDDINTSETHAFFTKALIYWEMVTSPVAPDSLTEKHLRYRQTRGNSSTAPQKPPWLISKRIAPHPWAGISSTIQRIFGEVLKNVQLYMTFRRTPTLTRSDLSRMSHLLNEVEILEEEAWYLELPRVEEIDDFGDADTPACKAILLPSAGHKE
ncbi:hypothetical protein IFR05_001652 [Cadophora sp. M221]|nr:hypothetical protein IFR05_001652 [Cadophora sp. M221]